jgi:hypothetical protein
MGEMRMCQTSVPYFSDLIIMSFSCEYCGAHSAETKNSGEVSENASEITLSVQGDADLKRDLFKVLMNILRVKHAQSNYLKSSYNSAMVHWEAFLPQFKACSRKYMIILRKATPSLTVMLSSQAALPCFYRTSKKCLLEKGPSP